MNQAQEPGKRIVSKGAYVKAQGKKVSLNLLGTVGIGLSLLMGFAAIVPVVFFIGGVCNASTFPGHADAYIGQAVVSAFGLLLLAGGILGTAKWGKTALAHAAELDTGVPLTRANTADLPAPDSLVRASQELMQAQEAVLLRAAVGETQERQEGQLLRVAAGREQT